MHLVESYRGEGTELTPIIPVLKLGGLRQECRLYSKILSSNSRSDLEFRVTHCFKGRHVKPRLHLMKL